MELKWMNCTHWWKDKNHNTPIHKGQLNPVWTQLQFFIGIALMILMHNSRIHRQIKYLTTWKYWWRVAIVSDFFFFNNYLAYTKCNSVQALMHTASLVEGLTASPKCEHRPLNQPADKDSSWRWVFRMRRLYKGTNWVNVKAHS